jgi:predicted small metal-binding protein
MFCPRCWAAFQDEWELYDLPTQFELECGRLGLTCNEAAQAQSKELRKWCRQHADSRYIPEKLLEAWGIKVLIADFEYPDWMRGALVSPSKRCASAE